MSYRSDVGITLKKESAEQLKQLLSQFPNNVLDEATEHQVDKDTGAELWSYECFKWGTEYKDIQALEDFLKTLPEDQYLYMRLGESMDDAEERGSFYNNPFGMEVSREITFSPTM